jgi:Rrf2 family protein
MKWSRKCEYALRALTEIAVCHAEGMPLVPIPRIARATGIPGKFLEQVLLQLKSGQFLRSKRGVDGGYALTRDAASLPLGLVVRHLEGPLRPARCGADRGAEGCGCPEPRLCAMRAVVDELADAAATILDGRSVGDLAAETLRLRARRRGALEFEI